MPSEIELPPMPVSHVTRENALGETLWEAEEGPFTADQMAAYALLAVKQERERCARLVMMHGVPMLAVDPHDCELIANAIRKG